MKQYHLQSGLFVAEIIGQFVSLRAYIASPRKHMLHRRTKKNGIMRPTPIFAQ